MKKVIKNVIITLVLVAVGVILALGILIINSPNIKDTIVNANIIWPYASDEEIDEIVKDEYVNAELGTQMTIRDWTPEEIDAMVDEVDVYSDVYDKIGGVTAGNIRQALRDKLFTAQDIARVAYLISADIFKKGFYEDTNSIPSRGYFISDKFSNNTLSIEELAKDIVEIAASEYRSVQDP